MMPARRAQTPLPVWAAVLLAIYVFGIVYFAARDFLSSAF